MAARSRSTDQELTRADVAQRLGCSQWQVVKLEREGKLKVRREKPEGQHGLVWYDVDSVVALAEKYKPRRVTRKEKLDDRTVESNMRGKIAAKALPMFEQGMRLSEICAATEADPIIIQQLYESWKLGLEGATVIAQRRKREETELRREREHAQNKRQEDWRRWKTELARVERSTAEDLARAAAHGSVEAAAHAGTRLANGFSKITARAQKKGTG